MGEETLRVDQEVFERFETGLSKATDNELCLREDKENGGFQREGEQRFDVQLQVKRATKNKDEDTPVDPLDLPLDNQGLDDVYDDSLGYSPCPNSFGSDGSSFGMSDFLNLGAVSDVVTSHPSEVKLRSVTMSPINSNEYHSGRPISPERQEQLSDGNPCSSVAQNTDGQTFKNLFGRTHSSSQKTSVFDVFARNVSGLVSYTKLRSEGDLPGVRPSPTASMSAESCTCRRGEKGKMDGRL